ncbi:MAG TPA: glycosyltransferase family 4 protein [Steroidobacteraceae bacterium]|nr:glycosyltransferase family 4 protein [Steroidobacteraceae bacterium]
MSVKVAHVTLSFERGGRREAILNLARGLRHLGIESSLVVLDHFGCPDELLRQNFTESLALGRSGAWDRSAWRLLNDFCATHGIDVLHTHDAASLFASAGSNLGNDRTLLMTFHRSRPLETATTRDRLRNALALQRCQAVITASTERRQHFVDQNFVSPRKLLTLPLGIDLDRFRFDAASRSTLRNEIGCADGEPIVGAVGHFGREKGIDLVVDACAELHRRDPDLPFRLVVVGTGNDEDQRRVREHAAALPPGTVHFAGFRDDVHRWFSCFDVFAHGAREEAFGLVIVEAMAAGRPVIAPRVGGITDIVLDERTGLLCPPEDSHAIAEALGRLVRDQGLRERLGQQSCERAFSEYRLDVYAARHARLYEALASGRRRFDDWDPDGAS